MQEIRKFNSRGEHEFQTLLTHFPDNLAGEIGNLIFDDSLTVSSNLPGVNWEIPVTRLNVGQALFPYLGPSKPLRAFAADRNLWNWLSAVYLCDQGPDAVKIAGTNRDAWLLNTRSNRYYRHRMFSAFFVYENHLENPNAVNLLLDKSLKYTLGEYGEQILATADIAYSVGAEVANQLYANPLGGVKSGASSKSPGSVRRLTAAFLNQIKLNVDFKDMTVEQILNVLPEEFDRYKSNSVSEDSRTSQEINELELKRQLLG